MALGEEVRELVRGDPERDDEGQVVEELERRRGAVLLARVAPGHPPAVVRAVARRRRRASRGCCHERRGAATHSLSPGARRRDWTSMPPKTAMPSSISTGASGSSCGAACVDPADERFTSDSIRHVGGVVISIPPKSAWTESRAPARELGAAQVGLDAAEPGQHRAAPEGSAPALELDAVEDRDERQLVALGVAPRTRLACRTPPRLASCLGERSRPASSSTEPATSSSVIGSSEITSTARRRPWSSRCARRIDRGDAAVRHVRRKRLDQVRVDRVQRASVGERRAHGLVDAGARELGQVQLGGLEPPTSWVRSRRSPN